MSSMEDQGCIANNSTFRRKIYFRGDSQQATDKDQEYQMAEAPTLYWRLHEKIKEIEQGVKNEEEFKYYEA